MNKNKLSVAMATYNGETYIFDQIKSILEQTVPPDEIIICDDLSEDNTKREIERAQRYSFIPIKFYKNNERLGYSRNFLNCIAKCSGDIIALSDQDDIWMKNKLEVCSKLLINDSNAGAIMHSTELVDHELNSIGKIFPVLESKILNPPVMLPKYPPLGNCLVFKHKNIASIIKPYLDNKNPLPQMLPGHDDLIHFFIGCRSKIITKSDSLIKYRRHDQNLSGNADYSTFTLLKKTNYDSYNDKANGYFQLKTILNVLDQKQKGAWSLASKMARKGNITYKLRSKIYSKKNSFSKKLKIIVKLLRIDLSYYPERRFYNSKSLVKDIVYPLFF